MKKQMLSIASKVVKSVVKKDNTKATFGFVYQPKRNK